MVDRRARLRFEADDRDLNRALNRIERNTGNVDTKLGKLGKSFSAMRGAIAAAGLLIAAERMIRLGKAAFDLGAAIEETGSKFNTVFGASAPAMDEFIRDFGRIAGLTEREGRDITATAGAIGQGFGFAQKESADFAQEIVRLSGDFASFQNLNVPDTFRAIKSAVVGQFEPLDNLGVMIRKADVDAKAFELTSKTVAGALTRQERVTATLALITEQMGVQLGDLEKTQDSSANLAKRAARDFRQFRDDLASVTKDALVPLLEKISELGDFLNENQAEVKQWARVVIESLFLVGQVVISSGQRFLALGEIMVGVFRTLNPMVRAIEALRAGDLRAAFTLDGLDQIENGLKKYRDTLIDTKDHAVSLVAAINAIGEANAFIGPLPGSAGAPTGSGAGGKPETPEERLKRLQAAIDAIDLTERISGVGGVNRDRPGFGDASTLAGRRIQARGEFEIDRMRNDLEEAFAVVTMFTEEIAVPASFLQDALDDMKPGIVNLEQFKDSLDSLIDETLIDAVAGIESFGDLLIKVVQDILRSLSDSISGGSFLDFIGDVGGKLFGGGIDNAGSGDIGLGLSVAGRGGQLAPNITILSQPTLSVNAIDARDFDDRLIEHSATLGNLTLGHVRESLSFAQGLS